METVAHILREKGERVHCVDLDATIYEAVKKMKEHEIGALIVTSHGRGVAMVAERDVLRALALDGVDARGSRIRSIATRIVASVSRSTPVETCMQLMTHRRLRHLPVTDGATLCGIISIGDVVKSRLAEQAHDVRWLIEYIHGEFVSYRPS